MQESDTYAVALRNSEEDLLLAAARVTQSLADLYAASGESCPPESMQRVAAAKGVEAAAAAAAVAVSEAEGLLDRAVTRIDQAAKVATTAAAAAEQALVAARAMVELEDSRYFSCTVGICCTACW